jgi:hypothetical protein
VLKRHFHDMKRQSLCQDRLGTNIGKVEKIPAFPAGNYTVDRWLDSLEDTVGGIDAAVLWSGYTNMGVDSRDQFDLMRSLLQGILHTENLAKSPLRLCP